MSRTLPVSFAESALCSARQLAQSGRPTAALARLAAALGTAALPAAAAAAAHRLAGSVNVELEHYAAARRHLRAAAELEPRDAGTRYQLGLAFQNDPHGCDDRAARCFRAAVGLAPDVGLYRAELGRALVRTNRLAAGVKQLRRAVKLAPTDAAVLEVVFDGLADAGRLKLAARLVVDARIAAPGDAAIQSLLNRVRFEVARSGQESARKAVRESARPMVLPFVRVVSGPTHGTGIGGVVRRDFGSRGASHLGRLRAFPG